MSTDHRTPGQLIQALLEERGWTQRALAIVLGVDEAGLNPVIAGKRPLRPELAIALEEVFGVPAETFLSLQNQYELAQARLVSRPDPRRAMRARLFGDLPIAEMIKRGWIEAENIRDIGKVEAGLARFFNAPTADEIAVLPHAPKKTNFADEATGTQIAWIYRVRQIAKDMLVARYSPRSVTDAISRLRTLLLAAEEIRKVPRILSEAGIRFVLVEQLPRAKIDGVCMWLDDRSPVIGMTLRHDRIDNFWFVLRHELEHVLRLHGQSAAKLDAELEGDRAGTGQELPEEERLANEAAAEFCVPQSAMDRFVSRKAPMFAERDILGFARTIQLHPGLVAGHLQHRTKRYDRFRAHQVKIRSLIAPSAVVDGWGDVAPLDI